MERRFFTDDSFEQFLKETTENFRMYPQRKVWYSLYNNLHPSKKWPSLSVLLLLVTSVMFIGVSNTKQLRLVEQDAKDQLIVTTTNNYNNNNIQQAEAPQANPYSTINTNNPSTEALHDDNRNALSIVNAVDNNVPRVAINVTKPGVSFLAEALTTDDLLLSEQTKDDVTKTEEIKEVIEEEISNKETIAGVNQLKKKKGSNRISTHLYITPSFGYRSMKASENFNAQTALPMSLVSLPNQPQATFSHNAAMGIELGGGIYYSINNSLRLKAGLQLNFTNYKIHAYGLSHAMMATVIMNGANVNTPDVRSMQTQISNVGGYQQISLNSNTFQFSVPIGADYLIAKNDKIKWYAGATVQPTYIAGGNAFMISADKNHYIADATILRKFNLNGSFETFISYQPIDGVTLNVGPQIRYQFLSTYVKEYPMTENLYNIGVKLGITTRF